MTIKAVTEIKKPVDPLTVERLEELLKDAKSGDLTSIMYVERDNTGEVSFGWEGSPCPKMIGMIEELKFSIFAEVYFSEE